MNNLNFNKIFAAILIAGIVAMLAGFVARKFIHPHPLHEDAVIIEAAEEVAAGGPAKPKGPEPILALLASADITKGQKVAKSCAACHSFDKGGKDGVGPHLWDIVNRKKDSVAGFAYSGALAAAGDPSWTYESLNKFLWKPKDYAPGTKMNYIGVKKAEDRAALIAYLRSLADQPAPAPDQARIDAEMAALGAPPEAAAGEAAPAAAAPAP